MSFNTDAARWRALSIRDPTANGQFVYTVKSTNIYCRPTCPARLARRANVGFCKTPTEAASAGFRACKRCKPDVEATEDPQVKAVVKACVLVGEALSKGNVSAIKLQDLAKSVGLTPRYFHKIFKDKMGMTPKEYIKCKTQVAMSEGTGSTGQDSPLILDTMNLDIFDFNEIVDLDMDTSLAIDAASSMAVTQPSMHEPYWDFLAPDSLDLGLGFGNDKLAKWVDATAIPDADMVKTTAAFDLDAAYLLNMGPLQDLNEGLYVDSVGQG